MLQLRDLYPALVTCLALLVYAWNFGGAGVARGKHKILAPATTGHPEFERKLRIQQNMVEQLIVFIPALWIFSLSIDVLAGAVVGLIFIAGRILYSVSYAKDPAKRGPGFGLSALANIVLLVGALIGVIRLFIIET
jgi:glutathione S-transferase